MASKVDLERVRQAINNSEPLKFRTHAMPEEALKTLDGVLGMFLAEMEHGVLKEPMSYCLRELTGNAKKANAKRIYFKEKGLNIETKEDYERGMKDFRKETYSEIEVEAAVEEALADLTGPP